MTSSQTLKVKNEALAQALEEKGITTEFERMKFADGIGVSERTVRRWIKGDRPHRGFQKAAARKLGRKPEELWP